MPNASFESLINFSRPSVGTAFNQQGKISLVTSNAPRFDFNPSTLQSEGILIEEQATNLFTYSSSFSNAIWTKTGSSAIQDSSDLSIVPCAITSIPEVQYAFQIKEDSSTGLHAFSQAVTLAAGKVAFSVYLKRSQRTKVNLKITGSTTANCYFDLLLGTKLSSNNCLGYIQQVNNNWYRCWIIFTASAGSATASISLATADGTESYTGDNFSSIYAFAAQIEQGEFPTSYIPTAATNYPREADVAYVESTNDWLTSLNGTLYVEAKPLLSSDNSSQDNCAVSLSDVKLVNDERFINLSRDANSEVKVTSVVMPEFKQGSTIDWDELQIRKTAYVYTANAFKVFTNGAVQYDSTDLVNQTVSSASQFSERIWCGHIRLIQFFPLTMTSEEARRLTSV